MGTKRQDGSIKKEILLRKAKLQKNVFLAALKENTVENDDRIDNGDQTMSNTENSASPIVDNNPDIETLVECLLKTRSILIKSFKKTAEVLQKVKVFPC